MREQLDRGLPKWFAEQGVGGGMEPRPTAYGARAWVTQREGGSTVREHSPLTIGLHHHHNAGAASTPLQERFDPSAQKGSLKGVGCGVSANSADEARRTPSSHGGHRNIGGAPAASSRDLGSGIGASPPWRIKPYGDLVDKVTHADDQWGRGGWDRSFNHAGECIGYPLAPWAVSSVG